MTNGESFKFASFQGSKVQIVAQWLCVGRSNKTSHFYVALYDEQHHCLKAKNISVISLNRLLSYWTQATLDRRLDKQLH